MLTPIGCNVIDGIKQVLKMYHDRIGTLEDEKIDSEFIVKRKDMEVVIESVVTIHITHKHTHRLL